MTEKVKITQAQADAFEYLRNKWGDATIIDSHVIRPNGWELDENESLNGMPLLQLVDALRIGYEIEPEYKVGDWIVCTHLSTALKIIAIQYEHSRVQYMDVSNWQPIAGIGRHATPEEIKAEKGRRVWAKIGREVNEFRVGDNYRFASGDWGAVLSSAGCQAAQRFYEEGHIVGLLPTEAYVDFDEIVNFEDGDDDA